MEEHEIELIRYLQVIWRRKGLIIGGTLVAAATALVVSLSMPKTYEVSRTLKIGSLPGRAIENREAVINRLKDDRVLKSVLEKIHIGDEAEEIGGLVSIDTRTNPEVRYTVQAQDPQVGTEIADKLADYIIKVHSPIFDKGIQITREHEAQLAQTIRKLEVEIESMKNTLKSIMDAPKVDAPAVILLQASMEDRERNLANLRRELKETRLSILGYEKTAVITADAPPKHPVKPRVRLNVVLGGTLGLMGFTFLAFFLEYIDKARRKK